MRRRAVVITKVRANNEVVGIRVLTLFESGLNRLKMECLRFRRIVY